MGRLSVVPGLSMRVRPVVFMDFGRSLVVRMRGMRRWSCVSQTGWRRARRWRVKPRNLALDGICLMVSWRDGMAAAKWVVAAEEGGAEVEPWDEEEGTKKKGHLAIE